MVDYSKLCGWKPDYQGITDILNRADNLYPDFTSATMQLRKRYSDEFKETLLYEPLVWADPNYQRGAQAIGSCAAWGTELAATMITAKHALKSRSKRKYCEASTEAIYGGMRVEVPGVRRGGWSDGAYGAYGAQWLKDYGVVYRKDYSEITGNPAHDLRKYSGQKEKNWGNYGCGGEDDRGLLDAIAREMPVKVISRVNSFEDVATAISITKSPVIIGSDYGCSMRRDKNGFCRWSGSWNHLMLLAGVRYDIRGALCFQSWGPHVASGPRYPESMPDGIAGTSWWIPERDVDRICRSGDCWALGDFAKWRRDRTDFSKYVNRHVIV